MRKISVLLAILTLSLTASSEESVGLVLSGGGAKGIAHIGFIQALEENGIPIDCVSGTSMGAIVGSLYASGWSPAEMMELLKSKEFKLWSSGNTASCERFDFVAPGLSPRWIGVNLGLSEGAKIADAIPTRLIDPLPMSFAFMELYAPATGACSGDFNRLMVPLRTVASDIWTHKPVVFHKGELSEAVRASMSFPFVFQPIVVDGNVLYDGGLYDVYPVNVMMEDFNPDRLIGINLSSPNTKPTLNNLIGQMECMIMNDIDYPFPDDKGVNVRLDLDRYSLLDWSSADTIYAYGYHRALEMMDTIKGKISARRSPAEVEAARARYQALRDSQDICFDSVTVTGTSDSKARYISYLMGDRKGRPMTMAQARSGFFRVASTGRMRNFVPHALLDTATHRWNLRLDADVDRDYKFAVGGYLTTAAGSMLYGSACYDPFSLGKPSWSFEGWAGVNYLAALFSGKINLPTAVPSRLFARVGLTQQRDYESQHAFYDVTAPAFLRQNDIYVKAGWEMAAGRHGCFSVDAGYGHLRSHYHSAPYGEPSVGGESLFTRNLFLATMSWDRTTLNDPVLASEGSKFAAKASLEAGARELRPWNGPAESVGGAWADFSASALHYFNLSRHFAIGVGADAFWSTRPLLSSWAASMVNAEPFLPLESGYYLFDPTFRANQWGAIGLHPVADISRMLQIRVDAWLFEPFRTIDRTGDDGTSTPVYGKWFGSTPKVVSELTVALRLPFGNLRAWVDYRDSDASRWTAGISFGLLLRAPGPRD